MPVYDISIVRKTKQIDDFRIEAKDPKTAVDITETMYGDGLRLSGEVKEDVSVHVQGVIGEDDK